MNYIFIFILLACLLFYLKPAFKHMEGLTGNSNTLELPYVTASCPTMLLEKDSKYYLFNKNKPYKEGENPIVFSNLEDYSEFVKRENQRGNKCPILFLQQSYNTQGEREYKIRPSPTDLNGGAPPVNEQTYINLYRDTELLTDSSVNDKPYNENLYPGFDPTNQDIGKKTPLDLMDLIQQTKDKSPNPEDPNWGGQSYTQGLVDSGYYQDNNVQIFIPG